MCAVRVCVRARVPVVRIYVWLYHLETKLLEFPVRICRWLREQ